MKQSKIIKCIFLFLITLVLLNVGFISLKSYISGTNEIAKLENAVMILKEEKIEMETKLEASQNEYLLVSEKLRRVEEEKNQQRIKNEKYLPIIKKASVYSDSNIMYMNMGFVEMVFTMSINKKVSPYVIFAIVDVESNFNSTARNKKSNAIGLGQITKGTGEFIHYNLMKRTDPYVHDSLLSASLNVQYMIEYVSYLVRVRGSVDMALKQYCGGFVKGHEAFYDKVYRPKLLASLRSFGLSPSQAEELLKSK